MTPPRRGSWRLAQNCKEGARPLPTNNRKVGGYRQIACFRRVCRGRIYASRGVFPIYRNIWDGCNGRHICRPYKPTRYIHYNIRSRAGHTPPLLRKGFYCPVGRGKPSPLGGRWRGTRRMRGRCPAVATNQPVLLQYPQISPSSVTCGDSFPQRGKPFVRFTCYIALPGWLQRAA